MDKARTLMRYMEAAERTLELIKLKAPVVILAGDMRLIREATMVLEDMAGDEWQKVVNQAHDDLLAYKESLEDVMVSGCCGAEILEPDICSQCREHCEPMPEGGE